MTEITGRRAMVLINIRLLDIFFILLGGVVSYELRFDEWLPPIFLLPLIALTTIIFLVYMQLFDGYQYFIPSQNMAGLTALLTGLGVAFSFLLIVLYFTKTSHDFSRLWIGQWALLTIVLSISGRILFSVWLRHSRRADLLLHQAVFLVGSNYRAASCVERAINQSANYSLNVARIFQVSSSPTVAIEGSLHAGEKLEALLDYIRTNTVDYLLLFLDQSDYALLGKKLDKLQELSVTILSAPIIEEENFWHEDSEWLILAGLPFRRVTLMPMSPYGFVLKGVIDYVLASLCLVFLAPLMALIAIAIKLSSPGAVLFKQMRHGFSGEVISVYKFRTMIDGRGEEPGVPQATKDDPRVTRIGRFLRQSSLDELPQLINVLRGEMSLVGPRPHAVEHNRIYEERVANYLMRHRVKPGITGWAQVNGWRGETDTDDKMRMRVQHDIYYINHWSLMFDLRILFMTLSVAFVYKNAY